MAIAFQSNAFQNNAFQVVLGTLGTLILRPNAAGSETGIFGQSPNSTYHWDKVDEESPDDWGTWLYSSAQATERDLYNIPNHTTETGIINFIKIYFRYLGTANVTWASPSLKSDGIVTDGTEIQLPDTNIWHTASQQWNINPADSQPWSWADIDALQIGVKLRSSQATISAYCTQVYVEVDYTPAAGGPKGGSMVAKMAAAGVL